MQRCLGARSEWDARMGVVFAGFMKIILPIFVVIPGIVAFRIFPGLPDPDQAYPKLVRELVPAGLSGVVMAGLASALLSHLSSVLNSSSTVFTMDLYKPIFGRRKTDDELVKVGRISAFVILAIATLLAVWFTKGQHSVFLLLQNVGAWVAAPISAVFLMGVLWRRTTGAAATFVLIFGFPYTWFVENVMFKYCFTAYDNWLNRTFVVWATSMVLMGVVSLLTRPPDPEKLHGMIWSWKGAALKEPEQRRSLLLWWGLFIGLMAVLHGYIVWFQFFR